MHSISREKFARKSQWLTIIAGLVNPPCPLLDAITRGFSIVFLSYKNPPLSHAPICKKKINVIEEHCVIFYAKFVIDDQVGSRIINVIQNILIINK